jgi:monoamine oxidase
MSCPRYDRQIWAHDEFEATSWASPGLDQHSLYIPAYHTTENNVIFVGEHTSITHAWVSFSLPFHSYRQF